MSLTPDHRHAYRRWLLEHDLQPEVVDAILETMPSFDWSNIARRDEVATKDEFQTLTRRSDSASIRSSTDSTRSTTGSDGSTTMSSGSTAA